MMRDQRTGAPVILGTVSLNGGDAALLEAQRRVVSNVFDGASPIIFDRQASVARRYLTDADVRPALTEPTRNRHPRFWHRLAWLGRLARLSIAARSRGRGRAVLMRLLVRAPADRAAFDTYERARAAFTPGGTMLVEHYNLLPRLVDWSIALELGCPLVVFTQSIGPFRRGIERRLGRKVLQRAALVLVRGEESRAHVRSLGVPDARIKVAPDPAFLLAAPADSRRPPSGRVAISVREWPHFRSNAALAQHRYEAAITALCEFLVDERGLDVVFVSTCQGVPEYAFDDSKVAGRIAASVRPDLQRHVLVDGSHHSPQALRDMLGDFDLVVATRLHVAILALDAGTPVVAVAYETKTTEVFDRIGMSDRVLDIETVDGQVLIEYVTRTLDLGPDLSAESRALIEREREGVRGLALQLQVGQAIAVSA